MRIINETFLVAAGREHPPAAHHLDSWRKFVKKATWRNLVDVRQTYPDTDGVRVRSGRQVLIFNIRRNDYRLIVAAMRAKLEQNPKVREILLKTGDLILRPDHIEEPDPPAEWLYFNIWMEIRSELQRRK